MNETVIGLFDKLEGGRAVIRKLIDVGFDPAKISLVTPQPTEPGHQHAVHDAEQGALIGGLTGLLLGVTAFTLPGVGPVLAGGWLATTLIGAGLGAAAGGIAGALVDVGVVGEEAHTYAEGVRRGGTLVVVTVPVTRRGEALAILHENGAVDVQERAETWKQERTGDMPGR